MKGVIKKVTINSQEIKSKTQVCFGRNDLIYTAEPTNSHGEFYISEINGDDWRYVHPEAPDRIQCDYFYKPVVDVADNGYGTQEDFNLRDSEWQLVINCLMGREVEVKLDYGFLTRRGLLARITHIYPQSPQSRAEETLIRIRDISRPHWTHHEDWDTVCEMAKAALNPDYRPKYVRS